MKDLSELTEEEWEARRCGRPTKSGKPCKTFSGGEFPCRIHMTELDIHYRAVVSRTHTEAFEAGMEAGREAYIREVEKAVRDAEEARTFRLQTLDGKQIVEVGGYAFAWDAKKHGRMLAVGDPVHLSGGYSGQWDGVVSRMGSSYAGSLTEIRG